MRIKTPCPEPSNVAATFCSFSEERMPVFRSFPSQFSLTLKMVQYGNKPTNNNNSQYGLESYIFCHWVFVFMNSDTDNKKNVTGRMNDCMYRPSSQPANISSQPKLRPLRERESEENLINENNSNFELRHIYVGFTLEIGSRELNF